jgi:hypothetical protein
VTHQDGGRSPDRAAGYDPIRRFGVTAFVLTSGGLVATEQAVRFDRNRERIEEACRAASPLIFTVHATRIVRAFRRDHEELYCAASTSRKWEQIVIPGFLHRPKITHLQPLL